MLPRQCVICGCVTTLHVAQVYGYGGSTAKGLLNLKECFLTLGITGIGWGAADGVDNTYTKLSF